MKDQRMAQPEEPMLTRPIDAMVTDIHHRAAALHRRRFRAAALACVGCLAVASAGVLALVDSTPSSPIKSPTSSARDAQLARYQQLVQETAEAKAGPTPQPPNQPVASGWSALEPSLPKSVPPEWSPLVISALQVLEYETHNDQAATLTLVQSQSPVQVQMSQGAVQVDTLFAFVSDGGSGDWTMAATSGAPFSDGGSVIFRGACTWGSANSSTGDQSGTCPVVLVTLVGDPTNPYSATVAEWTTEGSRSPITRTTP